MLRFFALTALAVGPFTFVADAMAQSTVECRSHDFEYTECEASDVSRPQLIHQISRSACILNRTWGYNPPSGYIWVSQGCAASFADVGGYHHGRGDTYDEGARHYSDGGEDAGALVGGLLIGALIGAAISSDHHHTKKADRQHDGCHGDGCRVDNPDAPPEPGQIRMR